MLLASASTVNEIAQFVTVLVIFIAVLVLTVFTSKWIGDYQRGKTKGTNVSVLESTQIAPGKFVQIIRVADKTIAVATCKDTVSFLCEVDEEAVVQPISRGSAYSFGTLLKKQKSQLEEKEDNRGES
ncbi:MAG: flagellar biosynthetic protein FliO [Lachnospiraceae bacterium]|nr:flagellar biosynthetic protein FliO [Lachnospiraceae bacterium]